MTERERVIEELRTMVKLEQLHGPGSQAERDAWAAKVEREVIGPIERFEVDPGDALLKWIERTVG